MSTKDFNRDLRLDFSSVLFLAGCGGGRVGGIARTGANKTKKKSTTKL